MTHSEQEEVKEILFAVLRDSDPATSRLLSQARPAVRDEVKRLADLTARMGDFLETPVINPALFDDTAPLSGELLDNRYRIGVKVGSGGFGTVFSAVDERLGRTVAVKVLHRGVLSVASLVNEVKALSSVDHPGIVGILDSGATTDGRHYLVTRFVAGTTLQDLLRQNGPLSNSQLRSLALHLLDALAEAHERKIFHRDLTPNNVMIETGGTRRRDDSLGRAVILDFGVARVARPGPSLPEERGDLRMLGSILLQAMIGATRPLDPAPLPRLPSPRWRPFFQKALAIPPATGFQSVAEMRRALPSGRVVPSAGTILIAVIALCAMAAAAFLLRQRSASDFPVLTSLTSDRGDESYPSLSPDGQTVFFTRSDSGHRPSIHRLRISNAESVLVASAGLGAERPSCSPDGTKLAFLRSGSAPGIRRVVIMPLTGETGDGNSERLVFEGPADTVAWAPDNIHLIVATGKPPEVPQHLEVLDIRTGDIRTGDIRTGIDSGNKKSSVLTFPPKGIRGDTNPAVSPDGRMVACVRHRGGGDTRVKVDYLDSSTWSVTGEVLLGPSFQSVGSVAWSPDSKWLYFTAGSATNRYLWRMSARPGSSPERVVAAGQRVEDVSIAARTWQMALSRDHGDPNIARAELSGSPSLRTALIIASTATDEEQAISPDGTQIAFTSDRTGSEQIWLARPDGSGQHQATFFPFIQSALVDNIRAFWTSASDILVTGNLGPGIATARFHLAAGRAVRTGDWPEPTLGVSRDGQYAYIRRDQNGVRTMLRRPIGHSESSGSPSVLVARGDITKAVESTDGTQVYYTIRAEGLWTVPVSGGKPERLIERTQARAFAVAQNGIYFGTSVPAPAVWFYRFSDRTPQQLFATAETISFGFDIDRRASFLLYTLLDKRGADLYSVTGFH